MLAALLAPAAHADECLEQVWSGTIGTIPVTLDFSETGDSWHYRGRYHYRDNLAELYLAPDAQAGKWREYDAQGRQTGQLELRCAGGKTLTGVWRTPAGDKQLPLSAAPGQSDAERRIRNLKRQLSAPIAIGANSYRKVTSPGIKDFYSVTLQGDGAGIQALNQQLQEMVASNLGDIVECASLGIMRDGPGHPWKNTITTGIIAWTADIVVLSREYTGYCGGAHGYGEAGGETYAVATGKPEDLRGWFSGAWPIGSYHPGIPRRTLQELVWKEYEQINSECQAQVSFDRAWPTAEGVVFHPSANAYIDRPCEEDVLIKWQALAPFLSATGTQRMNGLRGPK
ncbi:hypothetical protein GJ699_22565 [Duganella sp. FT80W]|uniref:Uncharacterized protein n=1 Tax=Duganella guangzhouensis TaxID=2666084 RepID=A0A6I2L7Y7_9BURK|nr:hypothetical protein [Duganella guangzhouensis]MRW92786.1 hypothetical protein [Duganella guangzhouensis]